MKNIFYVFTFSLLLTSCGPDFLLNEEREVLSESLKYNLHLLVTHSKEYDYENVYMKIHTKFPTKDKREEQITIQLANKRGEWEGKCNSSSCTVKVFLLESFKFPEKGDYTFSFEQFTRDSELVGIEKLHLQLFPMKEKS